jgi:hypothetical protein
MFWGLQIFFSIRKVFFTIGSQVMDSGTGSFIFSFDAIIIIKRFSRLSVILAVIIDVSSLRLLVLPHVHRRGFVTWFHLNQRRHRAYITCNFIFIPSIISCRWQIWNFRMDWKTWSLTDTYCEACWITDVLLLQIKSKCMALHVLFISLRGCRIMHKFAYMLEPWGKRTRHSLLRWKRMRIFRRL